MSKPKPMNHKSLGGFDFCYWHPTGSKYGHVRRKHRLMVTVDAEALAQFLGERAVTTKGGKASVCGGAVQVVDLGGVEV